MTEKKPGTASKPAKATPAVKDKAAPAVKADKPAKSAKAAASKTAATQSGKTITITLKRSLIGRTERQRATVRGLGLRRVNHTVTVEDTACTRGMINKVLPLLLVTE
jgi:large subunit ribosomal protein L30